MINKLRTLFQNKRDLYAFLLILTGIVITSDRIGADYAGLMAFGSYFALVMLLIFITGRLKVAFILSSSFFIILQLLNQLKTHYYKERLFFPDIKVALDLENAGTLLHYYGALLALLGLVLFLLINYLLFRKEVKYSWLYRFFALVVSLVLAYGVYWVSNQKAYLEDWQHHLPKGRGTVTNLLLSRHEMVFSAPVYKESSRYFLQKPNPPIVNSAQAPVKADVVLFLQESTLNPDFYDLGDYRVPALSMFDKSNAWVKAASLLRVQTFGGGTWLSEFSVLTGLNSEDFSTNKSSVFYTVAPHVTHSLFKELKQQGYFTVVLSPMSRQNYNAGAAYDHFGMDLFVQPQDFGYPAEKGSNLWKISTEEMLNYAQEVLKTYTDKPIFLFVLSMAEHGPYEDVGDPLALSKVTKNDRFIDQFNDYYQRIKLGSDAVEHFSETMLARDKPTLFVYFGDHHPNVGWKGGHRTVLDATDYLTQFVLRDNFGKPIDGIGESTDISFLGGIILEQLNLSISPFYQANIKMRHLCQGKLDECKDTRLVNSYKNYIYQDLQIVGP